MVCKSRAASKENNDMVKENVTEIKAPTLTEAGDALARLVQRLKPIMMAYELGEADRLQREWREAKEREAAS